MAWPRAPASCPARWSGSASGPSAPPGAPSSIRAPATQPASAAPSGPWARPPCREGHPSSGRRRLSPLRRHPRADHGPAALATRRLRGPKQLGDRQDDRRRLPLRMALERPRLARPQCSRGLHPRGAPSGSPAARPREQRGAPLVTRHPARGRAPLARVPAARGSRPLDSMTSSGSCLRKAPWGQKGSMTVMTLWSAFS
jgi:hypothetical protein